MRWFSVSNTSLINQGKRKTVKIQKDKKNKKINLSLQEEFSWTAQWDANMCEFMCDFVILHGVLHHSHSQSDRP